ncbi:MAG: RluA family pseudouridine synthase [Clostridiales bacterium]|nr:RluA family pseudouridine synthase [Clostridiales bacterium]
MINFTISKSQVNKPILNVISELYPYISYTTFQKLLRKKDIKVNGIRVSDNIKTNLNDTIEIYYNYNLKILYEDENIIIVYKPVQLEVIDNNSTCLHTFVSQYLKNNFCYPCHRIDRNTTGLVLFAKNEEALSILEEKIKNTEITKIYRCTIIGKMPKEEDTLKDYLFKDSKKSMVYVSNTKKTGYSEIITKYRTISTSKDISLLEVELVTGKTHQIRAHLAFKGHPILGDGKYGNNEINKKYKKKFQELTAFKLVFSFKTDAGILNYLKNKEIVLDI